MKILIIEDEPLAAAQLASHLTALKPDAQILGVCDTIKSAVNWFQTNDEPDLAFFDIHLGDGLSFEIFEKVTFSCPIIFITAFDQYAIQAFKVNSIDYLLKPIERHELGKALEKFENLTSHKRNKLTPEILEGIVATYTQKKFKKRFLVKVGAHLRIVEIADILYFYSFQKGTYVKLMDGKDYLLDYSLEVLEEMLDPSLFFRINRKYIFALSSIKDVVAYSNSRLKLKTLQPSDNDFLVAREKVKAFKSWLEGEILKE